MNPRDNTRAFVLLGAIVGGGLLFLGYRLFLVPFLEYQAEIHDAQEATGKKGAEILQIQRDQARLKQWRTLSLPGVENLPGPRKLQYTPQEREHALHATQEQYTKYLRDLLGKHKVEAGYPRARQGDIKGVPTLPGNVPVYTPLQLTIDAKTKLPNLVAFLEDLQTAPLLHRLRGLSVKQADASTKGAEPLTAQLTIEALVVTGAARRGENLGAISGPLAARDAALIAARRMPTGMSGWPYQRLLAAAVLARGRPYADIGKKNIFEGGSPVYTPPAKKPEPRYTPDLISFACLTDVTIASAAKANLYDRSTEQRIELKTATGSNWIPLLKCGEWNTVVRGQVLRIDTRGVVFRVDLKTTSPDQESPNERYQSADTIYAVPAAEVEELVKAKVVPSKVGWRVFKLDAGYWKDMLADKIVALGRNPKDFAFRYDLVCGKVLQTDSEWVVLGVQDKYCSFQYGPEERLAPHGGYCFLAVGQKLADALRQAVLEREVRDMNFGAILGGTVVSCSGGGSAAALTWGWIARSAGNQDRGGAARLTASAAP